MQIPSDFLVLRRIAVLCAALFAFQALILAQPAIVGPDTGKPGQALSYQLLDQGKPVSGVIWKQGFNPDRYAGNDYATSFRMKVTPQPDGSVQIVAPSPGRYRLVGANGGATFQKAVLIRSDTPLLPLRGLTLGLSVDYSANDAVGVQTRASDRLAAAKHMGVEWIALTSGGCLDLDQVDSSSFEEVWDTTKCYAVSQADLEWIIDEAHDQGYKIALHGGAGAVKGGVLLGTCS